MEEVAAVKEKIEETNETTAEEVATEKYLYVYGIIDKQNFNVELKGLRDKPIKKIDFQNIAILFSDYPVLHPAVEEKEAMLRAIAFSKARRGKK